jgi:hypothetical protein
MLSSILQDLPTPKELLELQDYLSPRERAELDALLSAQVPWEPFQGSPQEAAFQSEADVTGFGGAAGGGKTDLLLGLASTVHHRSIIFRRDKAQLEGLETRAAEMFDGQGRFNSQKHRWRLDNGKMIEFGGVNEEKDVGKYQGRPHDFKGFDELPYFTEYQFRFLSGWNRSTRDKQRSRVVAGFNPPTTSEGDWVIDYFGPWLDERHPRPARPGELRFYATLNGREQEVRNGLPFWWVGEDGTEELIEPKSRTFFPSRVEDNPILMASGYRSTLQALPEPLRSLMLTGKFGIGQADHPWQVIPTEWIQLAQRRWKPLDERERGPLTQVGCDPARGGIDKTCIAKRYSNWVDRVVKKPGRLTPDGVAVIREVIEVMGQESAPIHVDVIGIGSSPVDIGKLFKLPIRSMNGAHGSVKLAKGTKLRFYNKRAEWHWEMREALDPLNGMNIALPPERTVLADLSAPRYELTPRGIKVEDKADIKERIHRSPDEGESIIYSFGRSGTEAALAGAIVMGQPRNIPG